MDNDLDFLNDDYTTIDNPQPPIVQAEVEPAADDAESLKKQLAEKDAKLASLGFIVEELDKNPQKLYDIKAALVGQPPAPQQIQYQHPQPVQQPQVDTRERYAQLKEQFDKKALVEGDLFGAMLGILGPALENSQNRTAMQVGSSTASIVIGNFISAKKSADPNFSKVEPYFNQRLQSIPREQLATMNADMINQTLSVAYDAAFGALAQEAYARSAAKRQADQISAPAPTYGGGGRVADHGREAPAASEFSKEELELAKALGLSAEDMKASA